MPPTYRSHARPKSLALRLARTLIASVVMASMVPGFTMLPSAAPEPSPIPKRWQLEIEPTPLRVIVLDVPGVGPQAFLYLTYTVTNNSGIDLLFAPSFDITTDEGQVLRSGRDVPVAAVRQLMERLANPLLEDQIGVVGTLLRGEENAKESLAVWPVPTTLLSELTVFFAGFSGETATVEVPNAAGRLEKKVLRKTLEMRYRIPGELNVMAIDPILPFERRWIMR
ncbi:MAG: hypothetical protein ACKVW3_13530 [Phycisphaerales bacterium]